MSRRINKKVLALYLKDYSFILVGAFILAFGVGCFVSPLDLVTGGVSSVGIIVQHFVTASGSDAQVFDIVTWIVQVIFVILGFIFLGKKFGTRTVVSSFLYPLFVTLIYRIPVNGFKSFGDMIGSQFIASSGDGWALMILGALTGGFCVGMGVGLTYLGNGSTGGFDVVSVILAKHTPIKEGLSSFVIDGTLVLIGIIIMKDIPKGIVGILFAFVCAMVVQYTYVNNNRFVICEVVSSKVDEITAMAINKLDRTTTIYQTIGGYSGEPKNVIRVCIAKRQLPDFKLQIAQIDPLAFVTFVQASTINGEGFDPLVQARRLKKQEEKEEEHGRE